MPARCCCTRFPAGQRPERSWPGASGRPGDVALLTATSMAFALGASSVEGTKHLIRAQAGPLAGLAALPELRTLLPRLAAIAGGCDPLALRLAGPGDAGLGCPELSGSGSIRVLPERTGNG